MNLWLDDVRPAPDGWWWVKTVEKAKSALLSGEVDDCSLDHDLGACESCNAGMTAETWLVLTQYASMPNCEHFGTGYTLVSWMEENNVWPKGSVRVHSMNAVGRLRMEKVLEKHYGPAYGYPKVFGKNEESV